MKDCQLLDWAEVKHVLLPGERRCTVCGNGRLSSYFLHSPSYEIPICDDCVNKNKTFEGILAGVPTPELISALRQLKDIDVIWQVVCDVATVEQLTSEYSLEFLYHKFRTCIKNVLTRIKDYNVAVADNEYLAKALLVAAALGHQAQGRARRNEIIRDILLESLSFPNLFDILGHVFDPEGCIVSRSVLEIPYGGSVDSDKKQDVWAYAESFARLPVADEAFLTGWRAVVSDRAVKSAEILELARENREKSLLYAYLLRISPNPSFVSYRVGCIMTCLGRNGYPVINEKDVVADNGVSKEVNLWRVLAGERSSAPKVIPSRVEIMDVRVCSACGATLGVDEFYASAAKKKNAACIKCSRYGDALLNLIDDILLQEECKAALLAWTKTVDSTTISPAFAAILTSVEKLCCTDLRRVIEMLLSHGAINDDVFLGWLSSRLLRQNNAMMQYWSLKDVAWWRAVANVFACATAIALHFNDVSKRQWLADSKHCKIFNVALIIVQSSIGKGLDNIYYDRDNKKIMVTPTVNASAVLQSGHLHNSLANVLRGCETERIMAAEDVVSSHPAITNKGVVDEGALQVGQSILYRMGDGAPVVAKIKTLSRSKSWIELHTGTWICLQDERFEFLDFID